MIDAATDHAVHAALQDKFDFLMVLVAVEGKRMSCSR
jgi:hypothetical protein